MRAIRRRVSKPPAEDSRTCVPIFRPTAPVENIVRAAVEAFGRIDVLVNNAGVIRRQDALDFTEDDWDAVMDLNLKSLFFLAQAAARQFVKQQSGGKIINIASMLSFQGGIRVASYTASKSGVLGLTRLSRTNGPRSASM